MRQIWKYEIEATDSQEIVMPGVSVRMLDVQIQNGVPCLWALVEPGGPKSTIRLATYGTGHEVDSLGPDLYVGTFQLEGGALVFHVFAGGERLAR